MANPMNKKFVQTYVLIEAQSMGLFVSNTLLFIDCHTLVRNEPIVYLKRYLKIVGLVLNLDLCISHT